MGQDHGKLVTQAHQLVLQGSFSEAEVIINELPEGYGRADTVLAQVYHQLGIYCFSDYDDYATAVRYYKDALAIFHETRDSTHFDISNEYHNIGLSYRYLHKYEKALAYLKKAIRLRRYANKEELPYSYTETAIIHDEITDYNKALRCFELAIQEEEKMPDAEKDIWELAYRYNGRAIVYNKMKNFKKAIPDLKQAIHYAQQVGDDFQEGLCNDNLGNAYSDKGDFDSAMSSFQKAISIYQKYGDKMYEADAYLNMGIVEKKRGNLEEARKLFLKSHTLNKKYRRPDSMLAYAADYDNLGDIAQLKEAYQEAIMYYHQAMQRVVPHFKDSNFYAGPNLKKGTIWGSKKNLLTILHSKAKAFHLLYIKRKEEQDLLASLHHYQLADQLIDQMRRSHTEHESILFWREKTRPVYEGAIEVCYLLEDVERAFYFAEKSKSIMLLDALRNAIGMEAAEIPGYLVEREYTLKGEIYALKQALLGVADSSKQHIVIQQKIDDLTSKYDSLIDFFEVTYPNYYQIKYATSILGLQEVQQSLPNSQTAFVEYIIGDTVLYTICLTDSSKEFHRVSFDSTLSVQIDTLIQRIRHKSTSAENKVLLEHSWDVYTKILAPVLPPKCTQLIISPDGILHNLPFEVLIDEEFKFGNDKRDLETCLKLASYLIKKYPIHYAYSANVLLKEALREHVEKVNIAAFAPTFQGEEKALKWIQKEVERIGKHGYSNIYQNEAATEKTFKSVAGDYAILHLATHGIIDSLDSLDIKLLFTKSTDPSPNDGALHMYEVFGLRLKSDLVVLSACETGKGRLQRGEGAMNLARAFAYAGCPNTISSLWNLSDSTTYEIMGNFYRYLYKGWAKDKALQQAKLAHLHSTNSKYAHPYYWSTLVLIGNSKPLFDSRWSTYYIWLGLFMIVIVSGILFFFVWRNV